MGHWGWRCILTAFISVWVVGCSITHDSAPTAAPTLSPSRTLTPYLAQTQTPPAVAYLPPVAPQITPTSAIYTIQPGDTLLGIAIQFGVDINSLRQINGELNPLTLPIGANIIIPNPIFNAEGIPILPTSTPLALLLTAPTCYPTPTDQILCLGLVTNHLEIPMQRVTLNVQLLRFDGALLAESETSIEQGNIPAGGAAPYRALFQTHWQEYGGVAVMLRNAEIAVNSRFIGLDVRDQQAAQHDEEYRIAAVLHNAAEQPVRLGRAVITLQDVLGRVVGFRVVQLHGDLQPGADYPLLVSTSIQGEQSVTHQLYVEAEKFLP
ncbi:MAG: LysM peptidoglycan-binding domain-containing protein [Anaerolineae bacterium]|nr:LysM peptidoglycan-binding domain-containing protein [Anaerolineae bacterium]